MAANFITVNSQFKPFSFQEMLQPYELYSQAYSGAEQQLAALQDKAAELESLKDSAGNENAYNTYKAYADSINSMVDALSHGTYNPSIKSGLLQERRNYVSNIAPISAQVAKKNQLALKQDELSAQNPALRFSIDFHTVGIDDMMKNPTLGFKTLDLDKVMTKTGQAAEALGKKLRSDPKFVRLSNYYMQTMQRQGYTPSEVMKAIAADKDAPEELKELYRASWREAGGDSGLWSPEIRDELKSAINHGMLFGVGQKVFSNPVADPEAEAALKFSYWKKERDIIGKQMENIARIKAGAKAAEDSDGIPRSSTQSVVQKGLNSLVNTWKGLHLGNGNGTAYSNRYFGNRGEVNPIRMYDEFISRRNKYLEQSSSVTPMPGAYPLKKYNDSEASQRALGDMRKLYGNVAILSTQQYKDLKSLGFNAGNSGLQIMRNLYTKINEKGALESEYSVNGSDQYSSRQFLQKMKENAQAGQSEKVIEQLDYNNKRTGKYASKDEFNDSKTKITDIGHIAKYPDKLVIHVDTSDGAKTYLVDPIIYSTEIARMLKDFAPTLNQERGSRKAALERSLMQALTKLILRGHNQATSMTGSAKGDNTLENYDDYDTTDTTE